MREETEDKKIDVLSSGPFLKWPRCSDLGQAEAGNQVLHRGVQHAGSQILSHPLLLSQVGAGSEAEQLGLNQPPHGILTLQIVA